MPPDVPLYLLNHAGVLVFGATGALAAARKGSDLVTVAFFARGQPRPASSSRQGGKRRFWPAW